MERYDAILIGGVPGGYVGCIPTKTLDGAEARAEADLVLMAVGRKPVVEGWGAREAGLDVSPKGVVVDERMRTNLLPHPTVCEVIRDAVRELE